MTSKNTSNEWPILEFNEIKDTLDTLHQWIQIVGKIRLKTMPWQNHSWHSALYISSRGFTTQGIPFEGKIFQIDFDFEQHKLFIACTNEKTISIDLKPMTVADFYIELFQKIESIGIQVEIHQKPNEIQPAIPFKENTINKSYDPVAAKTLWQSMVKVNSVFHDFRGEFVGKSSPVHLFWGAFDLAVSRYTGNPAPLHQGGMPNMPLEVMQEAYSKEVSSVGFWPGSKDFPTPAFYAYVYPSKPDFGQQKVVPKESFFSEEMGEYFLKYEDVQRSSNPESMLKEFLQSTYEAAAVTSKWNRDELEK